MSSRVAKMAGRRWSDGLHQAVEAKRAWSCAARRDAGHDHDSEYFRMYEKLAGMTEQRRRNRRIHRLRPGGDGHSDQRPMVREDRHDLVYRTKREKYNAIMDEIERLNKLQLAGMVGRCRWMYPRPCRACSSGRGITHTVLNAKYQQEAAIVAGAGNPAR